MTGGPSEPPLREASARPRRMESFIVKRFPDRRLGTFALTGVLGVAAATTTLLTTTTAIAQEDTQNLE